MGTNYFIKRREPRMVPVWDMTHIAKTSSGWRAHFDGSSASQQERDPETPRIGSMDDLRGYLSTGEWEIVDEYDRPATLGQILAHDDYQRDGEPFNTRVECSDYLDREGYPWSMREFS